MEMTKLLTYIQPTIVPAGTFYSHRISMGMPGSGVYFAPDEKGAGNQGSYDELTLIRRLIQLRNDPAGEREITEKFIQIGKSSLPELIDILREGRSQFIRARAARILGKMGYASAVMPLCEMLDGTGIFCQEAVARALGEIGDKRAAGPLVDKLFRARPNVRLAIIETLGNIGGEELTVPLGKVLRIRSLQVRLKAVEAICKTGGKAAIGPLIEAFDMQNRHLRRKIRDALLEFGKPAVPYLNDAVRHEHPLVRAGAEEVLRHRLLLARPGIIQSAYRDRIGERGLDDFKQHVLPLAHDVLADMPELRRQVLLKLIDVASRFTTEGEIREFWSAGVSRATFEFQRHYEEIGALGNRDVSDYLFHINERSLLESVTSLKPAYILDGEKLDPKRLEWYRDRYRVCLVWSKSIDHVVQFLIGHASLTAHLKSGMGAILKRNASVIPSNYAVAVFERENVRVQDDITHPVWTLYGDFGEVGMATTVYEQRIDALVTIPVTVLTDSQVGDLKSQAKTLFEELIASGEWSDCAVDGLIDPKVKGPDAFVASKHQELALKFVILKYLGIYT